MEECYFWQSCSLNPVTLLKVTLLHECFSRFLNCKLMVPNSAKYHIFSFKEVRNNGPYALLSQYLCQECFSHVVFEIFISVTIFLT